MADGYEADRTEAYFSGRLKIAPRPRRLKQISTEKILPANEQLEKSANEKSSDENKGQK